MKNEKLTFTCGEGGEAEEFFVVEQTRLNGVTIPIYSFVPMPEDHPFVL